LGSLGAGAGAGLVCRFEDAPETLVHRLSEWCYEWGWMVNHNTIQWLGIGNSLVIGDNKSVQNSVSNK
jgi:hypothetical protein